jgi:predicted nucleic acid-binding protein
VIDSGAVTRIAEGAGTAVTIVRALVERGWQLVVPSVVLVECLTGDARRDANTNRFLQAVGALPITDEVHARAAAALRFRSGNPGVVDALVAESAKRLPEPVAVLTTDARDIEVLLRTASVRVLSC